MSITRLLTHLVCLAFLTSGSAILSGCQRPTTDGQLLAVAPDAYTTVFDAALQVCQDEGMPAVLRDRRQGVIETEPAIAPSMLEPWHDDGASLESRWANTVALHRRRVRIDFTPVRGTDDSIDDGDGAAQLLAPPAADLTDGARQLECRVRVYVERVHRPGQRRHTWSRRLTTRAEIIPAGDVTALPASSWTTVARDVDFETRLLARIQSRASDAAPDAAETVTPE